MSAGADAPSTLPEGTQRFEFGGLKLHGVFTDLADSRLQRVAVHVFDRRAGGQTEWMGRDPHGTKVQLVFIDAEGFALATQLAALLDENPTRTLVHPLWGAMRATCKGFDSARLSAHAPNVYTVPIEFLESNLDAQIVATAAQGVAGKTSAVSATVQAIAAQTAAPDAVAPDGTTAELAAASRAIAQVTSYLAIAQGLADAAIASANAGTLDPSLAGVLADVVTQAAPVVAAFEAVGTPEAAAVAINLQVLVAQCRDVGAASLAQQPAPRLFIVPADLPLLAIASMVYGSDGPGRIDALLVDNPAVVDPTLVRAGTALVVRALQG